MLCGRPTDIGRALLLVQRPLLLYYIFCMHMRRAGGTVINVRAMAGGGKAAQMGETRLISVTRANNVSIMLMQFQRFANHEAICQAIYTGKGLGVELLSLLLQACHTLSCTAHRLAFLHPCTILTQAKPGSMVCATVMQHVHIYIGACKGWSHTGQFGCTRSFRPPADCAGHWQCYAQAPLPTPRQ